MSLHPTGDFLLSTSYDKHWGFSDISTGKVVSRVPDSTGGGLTSCQFHPDGLIFGTGSDDSMVKVWDVKDQTNVANFPGHTGQVTNIAFSENGYYLATAACDSSIKIWDLRKLKNIKTLQMDEGYIIQDLCFDRSGNYMAFAGTDVRYEIDVVAFLCVCRVAFWLISFRSITFQNISQQTLARAGLFQ